MTDWNPEILKQYIAPRIDEKPELVLPNLEETFATSETWMQAYFMSSVFHGEFQGYTKLYAESILARSQIMFAGYRAARLKTINYVDHWRLWQPGIGRYLSAVGEWEGVFINVQIIYDLYQKCWQTDFPKDGKEDRTHLIANRIKHGSEDIRDNKMSATGMPMWLTKHGFATIDPTVTYSEIGQIVRFVAQIADCLSAPSEMNNKVLKLRELYASEAKSEVGQ